MSAPALPSLSCTAARPADADFQLVVFRRGRPAEALPRTRGSRGSERHRRRPLAPLAPHQPRPARDADHALERGSLAAGEGRVQEGARAEESDSARRVVQLTPTDAGGTLGTMTKDTRFAIAVRDDEG